MNYSKIMIFGRPGSGKSTFALRLSKSTGLPLYHLDKYFFESHWVERDYNEFLDIQQSLVNQDKWIMRTLQDRFLEIFFSNLKNFDILEQKIARKIIEPYAFKASSVKNIVNFSFLLHQSAAIPYFKQQELLSASN